MRPSQTFFLIFWLLFASCSMKPKSDYIVQEPSKPVAVVSREQEALDELQMYPTEFKIPSEGDGQVWARTGIFFREFLSVVKPSRTENAATGAVTVTGKASGGNYSYTISKVHRNGEYSYRVAC